MDTSPGDARKTEVRLAAVADIHFGRDLAGQPAGALRAGRRGRRHPAARRRPDVVRPARGGADPGSGADRRREDPDRGGARQSRVRVGARGARSPRSSPTSACALLDGELVRADGRRLRRREGVRRRLRRAGARAVGRAHDEAVRARRGARDAEARVGPGAASAPLARVVAGALRADPRRRSRASRARSTRSSGSSRLEEPIDRYRVTVVFHGHAHHGRPEGRTRGGVPVFNVAMSLLRAALPRPPAVPPVHDSRRGRGDPEAPAEGGRVFNEP